MKIRAEEDELAAERDHLRQTLDSPRRLTRLLRDELRDDVERFGDPRRNDAIHRYRGQAPDEFARVIERTELRRVSHRVLLHLW